jgi:hypothetical protein
MRKIQCKKFPNFSSEWLLTVFLFSLLTKITTGFVFEDTYFEDELIEQTNLPHRTWGLAGAKSYTVPGLLLYFFLFLFYGHFKRFFG